MLLSLIFVASFSVAAEYSTPEATISTYIDAVRKGDPVAVYDCFVAKEYGYALQQAINIAGFEIKKNTVYGANEVVQWGDVVPAAKWGDVDLEVEEILDGKSVMYSYLLREIRSEWKIVTFSAWLSDDDS